MIFQISIKSDFVNLADDLFHYNERPFEPTDNEDDPNLLVESDSFKAFQKRNEYSSHGTANPLQNQPGSKRFFRSVGGIISMQTHFVDQTKEKSHPENDSKIPNLENPNGKTNGTKVKLIKNMKYKFYGEKVYTIINVAYFPVSQFTDWLHQLVIVTRRKLKSFASIRIHGFCFNQKLRENVHHVRYFSLICLFFQNYERIRKLH